MAKEIHIPFGREMLLKAFEGTKGCTTRTRKQGDVGDYFNISGRFLKRDDNPGNRPVYSVKQFTVRDIVPSEVERVAILLYEEEGFDDAQSFRDYYMEAKNRARERWGHPPVVYRDYEKCYVHWWRDYPIDTDVRAQLVV